MLTWGNVSGVSNDRELLAIKPSGVVYDQLHPEHIVVVSVVSEEEKKATRESWGVVDVVMSLVVMGLILAA